MNNTDEIAPRTTEDFAEASRVEASGEGRYRADFPDGWQQGRGTFGGLVLGTLARAMEHAETDRDRVFRALNGEVVGPVQPGVAEIAVSALRRGSGLSSWEARLTQNGEVLARASAIFGRERSRDHDVTELTRPVMKPWGEVETVVIAPPMGPRFARVYEYRPTGPMPFAGGDRAVTEGWVRLRKPAAMDVAVLIGAVDAYWPASFARATAPRPMATVSFTFELMADPATLDASEPLYYRAVAAGGYGGFVAEQRELWTADGTLVALNPQTFAVIK
jgi:acyl-CoA thioesterase